MAQWRANVPQMQGGKVGAQKVLSKNKRREGEEYEVEWDNGFIRCSCLDFEYRQHICKHIRQVLAEQGLSPHLPWVRVENAEELLDRIEQAERELSLIPFPLEYDGEARILMPSFGSANALSYTASDYFPWALAALKRLVGQRKERIE